ncbi:MAG: hypothetical protein LC791_08670, partial [Acidobacteria bacterium]|nr:hypothetical protein [Acidobacteriota bacterium]
ALYRWLFDHVPGFDGLRVPARYAMVAACFLVMIAAAGGAILMRRGRSPLVAGVLTALALAEGFSAPIPLNATWGDGPVVPPPRVFPAAASPPVYHALAALPPGRVVAELPFGDPAWELRYVYYATVHHQRLVNGYSGGFPRGYLVRVASLQRLAADPARAWQTLTDAGTTHVVVHRDAMGAEEASAIEEWLTAHGARAIARFAQDVLYGLPRR